MAKGDTKGVEREIRQKFSQAVQTAIRHNGGVIGCVSDTTGDTSFS